MDNRVKTILYLLGIIVLIYIAFKYLLPLIFKVLGVALQAFIWIIMWVAIGFVIIFIVTYIVKLLRK